MTVIAFAESLPWEKFPAQEQGVTGDASGIPRAVQESQDAQDARALRIEAKLEKVEALLYEERARQREQQVIIDEMQKSRSRLHQNIGRWVERLVFGFIAAAGWLWDKTSGQ